jgi:anti-sigma factor RsiW
MSCSPFDLKEYFLGELPSENRTEMDSHVAGCADCREELQALGAMRAVLMSVPDEEPPRRIAFVSDKIFEPRWWQRFWRSGPQLGFASAAMLALAITVHAFVPAHAPVQSVSAGIPAVTIEAEIAKRLQVEVARAVAASEQQQVAKTMGLINARLQDSKAEQRELLLRIAEYVERIEKRNSMMVKQALYQP